MSVQIFKHFRKVSKAVKKDFFQGSAPPNFISFCLANQSEDELQASANTVPNLSATLTQVASHSSSSDPVRPLFRLLHLSLHWFLQFLAFRPRTWLFFIARIVTQMLLLMLMR